MTATSATLACSAAAMLATAVWSNPQERGGMPPMNAPAAESVIATCGKPNDYVQGFRFSVTHGDQGDRDKPAGPVGTTGGER